jgi:glycosyltransferase involved in cell wall biosynthesis
VERTSEGAVVIPRPESASSADGFSSASEPAPVSAVVLAYNEERNLVACLESLQGWVQRIFVVDSGSTDSTAAIAERLGATLVFHDFETHAKQWNWALRNLPIDTDWVLGLDADQRVTLELAGEIGASLASRPSANGFYLPRRQVFRGRWIKHGGYYPKYLLKLFRHGEAWADENDLVDHHFRVRGPTARLNGDIVEDNRNEWDISVWTAKHNRYARLQAEEELRRTRSQELPAVRPRLFGTPDEQVLWLKTRLWDRLPLYLRPILYFTYRYILRCGFLDGKQGFLFHFLQAYWYRLLVDINIDDLRQGTTTPEHPRR